MRLHPPGAAPRLRRSLLTVAAASVLSLVVPIGAQAADNIAAGGLTVPGSALTVGVSGASGQAGKLEARFSAVGAPLFWGTDTSNMNDGTASVFALNTPSGLYSAQAYGQDNSPFTQTSAPVRSGTGTVGDPYVVVSQFDATASIHITQTVTHVSGTTQFKATWAITNGSGSPTAMQAFEGADMYVNGNDNGDGTISGASPNRVIGSVASDGTQGQLVEQAASPFTHYYSGMNSQFYDSTGDSTFGSLSDTIDPTNQDSGMASEWDFVVGGGQTKTVSVVWNFTHPAAPQAPQITGGAPAANATTTATTASPAFGPAPGDGNFAISFQCALDGGSFTACVSPKALTGLAEGSHTFSVRALNSAGDPGPQTDRTWTVDTTLPGAPTLDGAPTGTVKTDAASITLSGENGATFRCSVDGGSYVGCSSPLVLTGLADGQHTVSVKQVDKAGNVGTLVDTATWTVDTLAPATPGLTGAPTGTVDTDHASIELSGEDGATFRCAVDGGAYEACTNPLELTNLSEGEHDVQVKQVDAAGNESTNFATASWTVDTVLPGTPTLTGAPTGTVAVDHASIELSGEGGASFRCAVDGGAFEACTSPLELTGLADGEHVVKVKQVDAAGNESAESGKAAWTVDTTVPAAPPVAQPQDTTATVADVSFTTPAGSTAECSLDDDPFQACVSPVAVSGLSVGTHKLKVRMINAAGTVGAPQIVTWEVQAPVVPTPAADTPAATPATPAAKPTATPAAPTAAPAQNTIAPAPVCVSRRVVTVHWKLPKGAKARGFTVLVGGKVVKRLPGSSRAVAVNLAGRTAGPVKVEIRTAGRGPALSTTRVYRTCVRKSASTAGQPTMVLKRTR